jgi:hypothetical protein
LGLWPIGIPLSRKSEETKEAGVTHRRLSLQDGGVIVERLEWHDDRARPYSYIIVSGPLPVAGYRSGLSVREEGPSAALHRALDQHIRAQGETRGPGGGCDRRRLSSRVRQPEGQIRRLDIRSIGGGRHTQGYLLDLATAVIVFVSATPWPALTQARGEF